MLKLRYIFASFIFILLVGVNSNARASVTTNKLIENSTDENQSENQSPEQEPTEIITDLDFFGAFSLVNVQLQWRDLCVDLSKEESDSDSSLDPKELYVDGVEFFSFSANDEIISTPAIIKTGSVVPVCTYRTLNGKVNFISAQRKQSVRTIAYILNCGTYPKSC